MKRMRILTCFFCAWMVMASPAAVMAKESVRMKDFQNTAAAVGGSELIAAASNNAKFSATAAVKINAAGAQAANIETLFSEAANTEAAVSEAANTEAAVPNAAVPNAEVPNTPVSEAPVPEAAVPETANTESEGTESTTAESPTTSADETQDQDRNAKLSGDTLNIEGYELFRPESPGQTLDILYKRRSARMAVMVYSSTLKTGDVKASEILVSKDRDSYRLSGSPAVKIVSKKGENLAFKVIFPRITYNGRNTAFGFRIKYKGTGMEALPLSVEITESEESSSSGSSKEEEDATPQPLVRVERVGSPQPVGAGERMELTLRLVNTSKSADIADLMISLTPGGSMYLMDDTNSRLIKHLNIGKSVDIKVNLQAGQDLSGASHSLDVEMKFNYYSANRLTSAVSVQKVMIPVKGNSVSGQPLLRISRVSGGETVSPGQLFQTVIRIENTSQNKDINGLMATWEPTEQISLMEAIDTSLIGDLKAGQGVDIPVRLKASAELSPAASQLIGVSLKYDYDSGKGAAQGVFTGKVVIPTNGGTGVIGSPTPNIIIRNYSYGSNVEAGQVFDLVMEMVNTSSESTVENVLMSLDTGEGISINDSSNTIYIPSMAPGAVMTKTVKMQALFQSKLQSPKIGISFKYEYLDRKERKQNTTNEMIAIPVYQPDRLEVRPPGFPDAIRQNEETAISIPYSNKGRGQIFNVEAKLEGDIDVLERQLTLGNFESGKNGTIDFVVTPRSQGKFDGKVIVAYEDEAQKRKELTVPLSFEVQDAPVEEQTAESEIPLEKPRMPVWILAAGILALAGCAGLLVIKRRIAGQNQNLTLTDDDTYEAWEDTLIETECMAEAEAQVEAEAEAQLEAETEAEAQLEAEARPDATTKVTVTQTAETADNEVQDNEE